MRVLTLLVILTAIGCSPDVKYVRNSVYQKVVFKGEAVSASLQQDVDDLLAAYFGTPDSPFLPAGLEKVLNLKTIKMSAGRVGVDEAGRPQGLYREHCAHCHGVSGDGSGPTAIFLNPYPRDYRRGQFKFKSTPLGSRPSKSDLKAVLVNGIPGTAMPSFRLLPDDEVESLVQYVQFLSIRGEFEREVLKLAQESGEPILEKETAVTKEQLEDVTGRFASILKKWTAAESSTVEVPTMPDNFGSAESVALGRRLFFAGGQCFKCHGESALGDGQVADYDDWTKEYYDGSTPVKRRESDAQIAGFLELGALPPRNIRPRNLRLGNYRGGRNPGDLYLRIRNGIEGTPMPGITIKSAAAPQGVPAEDIWHLVAYVRTLPFELNPTKGSQQNEHH